MSKSSLTDKFISTCILLLPQQASIVVGVSGGCDSIALLLLLHGLQEPLGIRKLVIAHINYGLRGEESDADETLVCSFGNKLQLPVFVRRLHGHSIDEAGMELWARNERYRFFRQVADDNECSLIATGHTLDDQAETVLMRLLRGSGLNGLRAIAPVRDDGVIRPLLYLKKAELDAWLSEQQIAYRYDASNSDTRLFRNRIRHEVLPQLEQCQAGVTAHLAALADEARSILIGMQPLVDEWIRKWYRKVDALHFRVLRKGFTQGNIAGEALRQLFEKHTIAPDRHHIILLSREVLLHDGGTYLLPDGWHAAVGREVLYFEKETYSYCEEISLPGEYICSGERRKIVFSEEEAVPEKLDAGKWTVYIDADRVGGAVKVRRVAHEDRIVPFGRVKELPVHEFLAKQGMVKPDRENTIVLVTRDNKTVWLHGIRLDDRFRVNSATKRVIKVQSSSIL